MSRCALHRRDQLGLLWRRRIDRRQWQPERKRRVDPGERVRSAARSGNRHTDDTRWFQKYFIGTRWYPVRRTSIDFGGYYKNNQYDYNFPVDSTYNGASSPDRYPAYLVMQNFQTYDGNVRLTFRPVQQCHPGHPLRISVFHHQHHARCHFGIWANPSRPP